MKIGAVLVCCQSPTSRTLSRICFVSHPINILYSTRLTQLIDLPLKQVPKPTTAYLDESEPLLEIPIWRCCSAAHESVNGTWLPALEQPAKIKEEEEDGRSAEEDAALAELFKVKMIEIPWVKAAARAAKRQDTAKEQKGKKKKQVSNGKKGEDV
jgi:hypothetical protein